MRTLWKVLAFLALLAAAIPTQAQDSNIRLQGVPSGIASSIAPGTTTFSPNTNPGGVVYNNGGVVGVSTTLPNGLAMQTPASINLSNGTALPLSGISTTQAANTFWGGPCSGGSTTPGFRALCAADLPPLPIGAVNVLNYIPPTLWASIANGTISNAVDLSPYIANAWAAALALQPTAPALLYPNGAYPVTTYPNYGYSNAQIRSAGTVRLRYTGSAASQCMTLDGLPNINNYATNIIFGPFLIECPAIGGNAIVLKNIDHSKFYLNVRGAGPTAAGLYLQTTVLNDYWLEVSSNTDSGGWYSGGPPGYGVIVDQTGGIASAFNTFHNSILEGVGQCAYLNNALGNTFDGGTCEGITGAQAGLVMDTNSSQNKIVNNMDFEANTTNAVVASSTASTISGTVLTVGGTITGTYAIGQTLAGTNVTPASQIMSLGSGTGGAGTYNLNYSSTISTPQTITAGPVDIIVSGISNSIINAVTEKQITISAGSNFGQIFGGSHDQITMGTGANHTLLSQVSYNRNGSTAITDNGTATTQFLSINLTTGTLTGNLPLSQVTGAAPLASPSFTGTVTMPDATTWASTGVNNTASYFTASTPMFNLSPTWNFSSTANSISSLALSPTLVPTSASAGGVFGTINTTTLGTSSVNVIGLEGIGSTIVTAAGYSGVLSVAGVFQGAIVNLGSNPIELTHIYIANGTSNGNGITTGTVTNVGYSTTAITAAAGAGGTVLNSSTQFIVPIGSSAGTTNKGLYITGNGGALSTNYALYSDSTAPSSLVGDLRVAGLIAPVSPATLTCGTGCASVTGNPQKFVATSGTAQASVTVNFGITWPTTPVCAIGSGSTASVVDITSISPTAITFGASVALTASSINVLCF